MNSKKQFQKDMKVIMQNVSGLSVKRNLKSILKENSRVFYEFSEELRNIGVWTDAKIIIADKEISDKLFSIAETVAPLRKINHRWLDIVENVNGILENSKNLNHDTEPLKIKGLIKNNKIMVCLDKYNNEINIDLSLLNFVYSICKNNFELYASDKITSQLKIESNGKLIGYIMPMLIRGNNDIISINDLSSLPKVDRSFEKFKTNLKLIYGVLTKDDGINIEDELKNNKNDKLRILYDRYKKIIDEDTLSVVMKSDKENKVKHDYQKYFNSIYNVVSKNDFYINDELINSGLFISSTFVSYDSKLSDSLYKNMKVSLMKKGLLMGIHKTEDNERDYVLEHIDKIKKWKMSFEEKLFKNQLSEVNIIEPAITENNIFTYVISKEKTEDNKVSVISIHGVMYDFLNLYYKGEDIKFLHDVNDVLFVYAVVNGELAAITTKFNPRIINESEVKR